MNYFKKQKGIIVQYAFQPLDAPKSHSLGVLTRYIVEAPV